MNTLKTFLVIAVFGMTLQTLTAQVVYPKGIYITYEDFARRKPSDTTTELKLKPSANQDNVVRVFKKGTTKRLKRNFAVCDGQNLYVRIKLVSKKFLSKDRGQMKDDGNYCIKVEQLGPNYLYFEDYFTSGASVFLGGVIASSASRRLKGIVYDLKLFKFDLFRNAKDFKQFLEKSHPQKLPLIEAQEKEDGRKKSQENIDLIRKIITDLNSNY
ncbi:MAG: Uncharacterised protein [Polaribacter sejongensis]|nr:MAG: Uncharacterised protein [Polaribacter sejongensis]|tara:strand:+ start:2273 stop:2914 length:642 start_codon:yes stop_codon:yes gene_type:complete